MTNTVRTTILCYGDSNTHGTCAMLGPDDLQRFRSHVRWPGRLASMMGDKVRIVCEGLPGRTTVHDDPIEGAHKNGLSVLPAILESHRPIGIVVLMLGTNDLKSRFAVTSSDIARSIQKLLSVIAQSRCGPAGKAPKVLLIAPVPIREVGFLGGHFAGGAPISHSLAELYSDLAAAQGCAFLDAGAVADVDPVDGVHLTRAGHEALSEHVAAKLRTMLPGTLSLVSGRR
jgi:lysophospholipase L1-like esterase